MTERGMTFGGGDSAFNGPDAVWQSESVRNAREQTTTFWDLI